MCLLPAGSAAACKRSLAIARVAEQPPATMPTSLMLGPRSKNSAASAALLLAGGAAACVRGSKSSIPFT
jgi:hypothetical protein